MPRQQHNAVHNGTVLEYGKESLFLVEYCALH